MTKNSTKQIFQKPQSNLMFAFEVRKHPPTFSTVFTVKATKKFKQDCKKMIIMEQDYSQVL